MSLVWTVSCSTIAGWFGKGKKELETGAVVEPIKMDRLDISGADLMVDVTVVNKNKAKLLITGYDYKITIGGKHKIVVPPQKTDIEVKDESHTLKFVHPINFEKLEKENPDLKNLEEAKITIEGLVYVTTEDEGNNFEFKSTQMMPIAHLPKITSGGVEVKDISYTSATLLFKTIIDNRNPFPVTYTPSYSIHVGNFEVASMNNGERITVDPKSKITHKFEKNIKVLSLSESIRRSDSTKVEMKTILDYKGERTKLQQKVIVGGEFDPPMIPKVKAKDVGISMEGTTATLNLEVEVDNPNSFSATIKEWDFNILLNNVEIVKSLKPDPVTISAKSKKVVTIPLKMNAKKLLKSGIAGNFKIKVKAVLKSIKKGGEDLSLDYVMNFS